MKTTRKHLRLFCLMLCIAFLLISCGDSEDLGSDTEISDSSEIIDSSAETSGVDNSDASTALSYLSVVEEKGLEFKLTEIDGKPCYSVSGGAEKDEITEVDIPSSVNGLPVRIISDNAFVLCESLTSVNIPDGVTTIGTSAFYGCTGLTSLTIPNSVTSIGFFAFSNCSSLASINIPDGVTIIENSVFCVCKSLTAITLPEGVTSIGEYAFIGCASLTEITIPKEVASIGKLAFGECSSLDSITVSPDNEVYHSAGNCIIETGSKTLVAGCKNSVIPDDGSVTIIGEFAFEGCKKLTDITIPNGITSVEYGAFYGCISLTGIAIPDSVTSLGAAAFEYCRELTSAKISNSLASIENNTFHGCSGLTDITIPVSVTSIENAAFRGCTGLTSIIIPRGVATFGRDVFASCSGLENMTVSPENKTFHSAGNCIIETNTKTLRFGCKNSVIPDDGSVTSIGEFAFYGCSGLTGIAIPDCVTDIVRCAFEKSGLTSITIPDGVTIINERAFAGCTSLTDIAIPDSVTYIDHFAFGGCSSLTSITIPDNVTTIESYALGRTGLKSINIPAGVTSISCYTFERTDLENMTVSPENKTFNSAGNCIIETKSKTLVIGCKNSVIPTDGSVTSIGDSAFFDCPELTSIVIPDCVTDIGGGAFSYCKRLTSITIPGSTLISVGENLLIGCEGLTDIEFIGTKAEWQAFKEYILSYGVGNVVVHCTDGDITFVSASGQ